ncbi:aminoacyl tRNA synthase complex-interacting multifunctional protein 1-like [Dorcoceras hygrometricum]|uniref:Aminoacyl tRNA synthase complex-interacting multifunctional protein 1-like n=1 Tax=Dorcoceras hygrometricum TaxID=472368 RepID=A0A2Z7BY43_9LAMI|nr:aminoacyl tRNA synthase complex-interacting multifunctional protein 1-like [Dorcoceras hygrometricum]
MVNRLATSPHDPLGITDSACKNQSVMVSVQYDPFNSNIPIRSTTIDKSRVARDPITMHTSWRSNSDITCVTRLLTLTLSTKAAAHSPQPHGAAAQVRRRRRHVPPEIVPANLDKENPSVPISSGLLVQADEGIPSPVMDLIDVIYRNLPFVFVLTVLIVSRHNFCSSAASPGGVIRIRRGYPTVVSEPRFSDLINTSLPYCIYCED